MSDACPDPIIFIALSVNFLALSEAHNTTAAAPSLLGAQSSILKGVDTIPDLLIAAASSAKGN